MSTPTALAALLMALGMISVLRATAIIATSGQGRFRFDPWLSLLLGFTLILLGQALLA